MFFTLLTLIKHKKCAWITEEQRSLETLKRAKRYFQSFLGVSQTPPEKIDHFVHGKLWKPLLYGRWLFPQKSAVSYNSWTQSIYFIQLLSSFRKLTNLKAHTILFLPPSPFYRDSDDSSSGQEWQNEQMRSSRSHSNHTYPLWLLKLWWGSRLKIHLNTVLLKTWCCTIWIWNTQGSC